MTRSENSPAPIWYHPQLEDIQSTVGQETGWVASQFLPNGALPSNHPVGSEITVVRDPFR